MDEALKRIAAERKRQTDVEGNLEFVYEEKYLGPCARCGKSTDYTLDTSNEEEYEL